MNVLTGRSLFRHWAFTVPSLVAHCSVTGRSLFRHWEFTARLRLADPPRHRRGWLANWAVLLPTANHKPRCLLP